MIPFGSLEKRVRWPGERRAIKANWGGTVAFLVGCASKRGPVAVMSKLLLTCALVAALGIRATRGVLTCDISISNRERCGDIGIDEPGCLALGCCFDLTNGQCFQKEDLSAGLFGFSPTLTPQREGGRGHLTFGGEPGYSGNKLIQLCPPTSRPCLDEGQRELNPWDCQRKGCCWNSIRQRCYRSVFFITRLRENCPPGFRDPPACHDIDDCASNPCKNGGTCVDKTLGYTCVCPAGTSGTNCDYVCGPPPGGNPNLLYSPAKDSYAQAETVEYSCTGDNTVAGTTMNMCTLSLVGNIGVWLFSVAPVCQPGCTSPPAQPEATHTPTQSVYAVGEFITYSCTAGTLVGRNILICLNGGVFDPPNAPQCNTGVCPPVPPIINGLGSFDPAAPVNLVVGTTVTYTCAPGYTPNGATQITCLAGGTWSGGAPICERDCGNPPDPLTAGGGTVQVLSGLAAAPYPSGTVAQYSCTVAGYVIVGNTQLTCQPDGNWNSPTPVCQNECVNVPLPANGQADMPGTSFPSGTEITYSCNTGFGLRGDPTNTCLSTLAWSNAAPECKQLCGPVPNTNADPSEDPVQADYVEGESVTWVCATGNPTSPFVTTCTAGEWTVTTEPTCSTTNCEPLPLIAENGSNSPAGANHMSGATVTYSCNANFLMVGLGTNTCDATTNQWNNPAPTCVAECGTPPSVPFSTVAGTFGLGQAATYTCNDGYVLSGSATVMCNDVGGTPTWDTPTAVCNQGCTAPPANTDVIVTVAQTTYAVGDTVTYSCPTGQNPVGPTMNECLDTFQWKYASPTCSATECPTTPTIENGSVTPTTPLGVTEAATYTCNEGYTLNGAATITCVMGADMPEFSASAPTCVAHCPELTAPDNQAAGSPTITPAGAVAPYPHGTTITYACATNYVAVNPTQMCVLPNSAFTPGAPQCLRACADPPLQPGTVPSAGSPTAPFKEGDVVNIECGAGENGQIVGQTTNVCLPTGEWQYSVTQVAECLNVCINPPALDNASIDNNQATYAINDVVTYTCATGYSSSTRPAKAMATCQPDRTWDSVGTCLLECPDVPLGPALVTQESILPGPFQVGTTVNYECAVPALFNIYGGVTMQNTCQQNGQWEFPNVADVPSCTTDCVAPPSPTNGFFTPIQDVYAVAATVTYFCNPNYRLVGSNTNTCNLATPSTWAVADVSTLCRRICLAPTVGDNVSIAPTQVEYLEMDVVTFACNDPLFPTASGATSATCQSTGLWDYGGDPTPQCGAP